jgi:hypothetical protein
MDRGTLWRAPLPLAGPSPGAAGGTDQTLLGCSPLMRQLMLALRTHGVPAKGVSAGTASDEPAIVIAEADKEAAIGVLLWKLTELQTPSGLPDELGTALAA